VDEATFSLAPCGPIDRIQEKIGLARPGMKHLLGRGVLMGLIAWLPLVVMTLLIPRAQSPTSITFLQDIAAHVRFLVVIPLLVVIEASIGARTNMVISDLVPSGLVIEEDLPRFRSAVQSAGKMAQSNWAEAALLVITAACVWIASRSLVSDNAVFWYEDVTATGTHLSWMGRWYMFVSTPLMVFLFLRWGWRYFVWARFLRRTSKLNLRISHTHPDRSGGLAFVNVGHTAFAAVGFAASCMVAAAASNRILYEGAHLKDYQSVIIGFIVVSVVLGLAPLFAFLPTLVRAKRRGLIEYGRFGSRYVQAFEEKWVRSDAKPKEPMLGSSDIQSLADLGGSYERLDNMRVVPFDRRTAFVFAFASAAPVLPLLLMVMPLREIISLLLKTMM
jgi:hypothetical protein